MGPQHVLNGLCLSFRHRQVPMCLYFSPVRVISAPICLIRWLPLVRSLCTLGAVGPRRNRDRVVGVRQAVGVVALPFSVPCPSAGVMGIFQRRQVIDVQVSGHTDYSSGEGCNPLTGGYSGWSYSWDLRRTTINMLPRLNGCDIRRKMAVGYLKDSLISALHLGGPLIWTKADGTTYPACEWSETGRRQPHCYPSINQILQVATNRL